MLAAFGDPKYPTVTRAQTESDCESGSPRRRASGYALEPLPASRKEVEGIARLFAGRAASYVGEQATEERAKAIGKDVRYLHFASHGLLDERFPLNSALALTIPERPAEGQANGLLQAWEIFEQMRIDADLVTLSACETGLGKELGGEGLMGLTRAFQYAGARSVLASLWSVADESTAELMTRFYGHLKAGKTKDDALRTAQLEMIRASGALGPAVPLGGVSTDWRLEMRNSSRFARATAVLLLTLVTASSQSAGVRGQTVPRGAVVEEVGRNSSGEKAGIRPGDVVQSWVRAAAPPANPDEARGEVGSPFDLDGSRNGASSTRGGEAARARGTAGLLGPRSTGRVGDHGEAEPGRAAALQLPARQGADCCQGDRQGPRRLAGNGCARRQRERLRSWPRGCSSRIGDTLANARRWDEAHAEYRAAIEAAKKRGDPALVARMLDAEGGAFERQNDYPKSGSRIS